jgi:hypothetical protein
MPAKKDLFKMNLEAATARFGELSSFTADALKELTAQHQLSIPAGDLVLLDGHWYVTHAGLLRLSRRKRCRGIRVNPLSDLCDPAANRWRFQAVVYTSATCKGFYGYGDADPSNVSALVRGAEMRMAETRAVNRALRKAYGIGLCSVEEIGNSTRPLSPASAIVNGKTTPTAGNGNGHRLRDRLCLLIRQHRLDSDLVKRYATAFCGTNTLREATREQVEKFINHLAQIAEQAPDSLHAQLARFAQPQPAPGPDDKEAA